jgi:hypothetical protein
MAAPTDDYSRWFWVYFGYNYIKQKAFAYVKFNSGVRTLEWNNVHHILPVYTTWYLSKDPWYAGFAGKVRKFTLAFGKGVYQESDYEDLQRISRTGSRPNLVEFEDGATPETQLISQWYENVVPTLDYKLDDLDDYNITEYGFSFYYRASLYYPVRQDLGSLRGNWRFLGGLSENGDCAPAGRRGDRTLCIYDRYWNAGPGLHLTTYDSRSGNMNYYKDIPQDWSKEYDNQWNFIYFGYSKKLNKAYAYIKYTRTGTVVNLEWNDIFHIDPLQRAFFQLGKTPSYKYGLNGRYAQVRLDLSPDCFLGSQDAVE